MLLLEGMGERGNLSGTDDKNPVRRVSYHSFMKVGVKERRRTSPKLSV